MSLRSYVRLIQTSVHITAPVPIGRLWGLRGGHQWRLINEGTWCNWHFVFVALSALPREAPNFNAFTSDVHIREG